MGITKRLRSWWRSAPHLDDRSMGREMPRSTTWKNKNRYQAELKGTRTPRAQRLDHIPAPDFPPDDG